MKDISINTPFLKVQYWISWVGFILTFFSFTWIIAIYLASYGKTTSYDVEDKKGILNKTWEKFVFIWGSILGDFFILMFFIEIIKMQFTGVPF